MTYLGCALAGASLVVNSDLFKRGAATLVVILLFALGIKLISDGVDISGESSNAALARIAGATAAVAVGVPVLLFVVLGLAHP